MSIFDNMLSDEHPIGQLMTEPTLLSQCKTRVTLDEKEEYSITIEDGEFLLLRMGFSAQKPAAKFTHPNIVATSKVIHEFKHYRYNGSKFWTSKAGIDHYLIIPRNKIFLLPEKGYSYIRAEINGVKVVFSVSGGGGKGWTDFLTTSTSTGVDHKLADLKKIAEVAVRNSPFEPLKIKQLDKSEEEKWNKLLAKATPSIKHKICQLIEKGKRPIIHLASQYSYDGSKYGPGIEIERTYRRRKTSLTSYEWKKTGALKSIILDFGYNGCRAKVSQIDWYKTAKENAISV